MAAAGFGPGMLWGCGVKREGACPSPGLVPPVWGHLLVPLSLRGHQAAGGWHSTLCSLLSRGFVGKRFQPRSQTHFPRGLRCAGELRQPDGSEPAADSQIPPRACGSHIWSQALPRSMGRGCPAPAAPFPTRGPLGGGDTLWAVVPGGTDPRAAIWDALLALPPVPAFPGSCCLLFSEL